MRERYMNSKVGEERDTYLTKWPKAGLRSEPDRYQVKHGQLIVYMLIWLD